MDLSSLLAHTSSQDCVYESIFLWCVYCNLVANRELILQTVVPTCCRFEGVIPNLYCEYSVYILDLCGYSEMDPVNSLLTFCVTLLCNRTLICI